MFKNQYFKKDNKGSAILISILVLGLIILIISSISNIYTNKLNSIKNLNKFYDNKIIENMKSIK